MEQTFIASVTPSQKGELPARWFIFSAQQILLLDDGKFSIPGEEEIKVIETALTFHNHLGLWQHQQCFCAEMDVTLPLPPKLAWFSLKQIAERLDSALFSLAGFALQILQWDKHHQFCGQCGTPLVQSAGERVKICQNCALSHYPRISPSIIVLIKRGKEVLLARSPHFTQGVYSALAGFVEPGESAEEALQREVMEEVGLRVKNVRYWFSQSWPFPHTLMLAYTAEYAAGEIIIDGMEIEDAGWFTVDNLPLLPSSISIARKLIDLFIYEEF